MTEKEPTFDGYEKLVATGNQGPRSAAWVAYYQYGDRAPEGTPRAYGLIAIKTELKYNGYGKNLVVGTPVFGDAARNRAKEFQGNNGLIPDGVVGPRTARALFRKRIFAVEASKNIPNNIVYKKTDLESGFDPAAVGVSGKDLGLNQIHQPSHPNVTTEQAFTPAFSVPWSANYLVAAYTDLKDWDAALASYNVGRFYAGKWLAAGKPATGLFTTAGKDYAIMCTKYVSLVLGRKVQKGGYP